MLGLQAATLEDQARLFSNQVVQAKNEILVRELDFYHSGFSTIMTAAAVLAGFAFSGLVMSQAGRGGARGGRSGGWDWSLGAGAGRVVSRAHELERGSSREERARARARQR